MLSRTQKVYFGMARLGPSIMLDMLDLASALFYFSIQMLPAFYTGISIAMSYIAIMLSEVIFGNLSDRTPTRWGRRKPFIIIGAPLMALSFLFVFTPHWFINQGDVLALFIYAIVTMSLFKVAYGMTMTPFQSWMPELTEPEERPAVSSWQNVANFGGFVVGTFGVTLLAIQPETWGLPPEILYMIIAFIVIQLLLFVPPLLGLKKEGKFIPQPDLKKNVSRILKNRDYVGWLVAQGLLSVGVAMIIKSTFPYIDDYLRFGTTEFIIFGVELLAVVFIFFAIWRWMIKNKGKRITLQTAMMVMVVALPFTLVLNSSVGGFVMIALVGSGIAGYYLFPYIIYADFAHKDELLTGEGHAGLYTSFPSIPLNGAQAFSAFLWGIVFGLPAVVPAVGAPSELLTLGYLYWGPISALFIFLSVLALFKVNLDPDFDELQADANE